MKQSNRWQIHQLLAEQMDERLAFVTAVPQYIALVGADNDISRQYLAARYPKAQFHEYDPRADFLAQAAAQRHTGFFAKLTGKTVPQSCQSLIEPLPIAWADMLWANLSFITASEPVAVFENWAQCLRTHGLLFFTHLGGDSLRELRELLAQQGMAVQTPMLFDMHDLGDMLFHHGFYDPVMDTAKLVLDYHSAERFWQDMETLGVWSSLVLDDEAAARAAIHRRLAAGHFSLTLETVFGHAVKKQVLPAGENPIQFFPKRKNQE